MAASGDLGAQAVIAFDVRLGLTAQDQCLRRVQWRPTNHFAIDQPVQQVQHMGFGRHAFGHGQFHGGEHGLFVMLQHEGQDIDHLAIADLSLELLDPPARVSVQASGDLGDLSAGVDLDLAARRLDGAEGTLDVHLRVRDPSNIAAEVRLYLKQHALGRVTGADGGYIVAGHHYIPDVAFISYEKQSGPSGEAYNPNPPDLAVEVVSPSDRPERLMIKVGNYLAAGVVVWVVYPTEREVQVYKPGQPVELIDGNGTLSGGDVLPGFELMVKDIFPEDKA